MLANQFKRAHLILKHHAVLQTPQEYTKAVQVTQKQE